MNLKLKDKVAVVTGASKGIGAGIARAFAAAGAKVVVNYATDKSGAEKVVGAITGQGGAAISVGADVARTDDISRLFDETLNAFGRVDILVNNAGVFQFTPLSAVTEESFRRNFNTNVLGTILASQKAAALFGEDGGSIINISSISSTNGTAGLVEYGATKSAMDNITKTLSVELAPQKIRVNAIAPGMTETEGTRSAGIVGGDAQKQVAAATPLGRIGQPEDVAKVAVFLASDDAGWITGERITVAGGLQ